MNLTNFRFETDADGIALATWDMPGRSMNVITPRGDGRAVARSSRRSRPTPRSRAASSPPARRRSPAAPTSPCCRASAREYAKLAQEQGRGGGDARLLRGIAQAVAALPAARDLRQAVRGGDPRRLPRRRLRAGARLPSPGRVGRRRHPRRPARGQGRAVPRRRRHAARGAADADRRRAADAVQGRADPPADGAATWASCTRSRRATRSSRRRRPGSAAAARPSRPGTRRGSSCRPARSTRPPA